MLWPLHVAVARGEISRWRSPRSRYCTVLSVKHSYRQGFLNERSSYAPVEKARLPGSGEVPVAGLRRCRPNRS